MKFKVGDKVRVVNNEQWKHYSQNMDCYINTVQTIRSIEDGLYTLEKCMNTEYYYWRFGEHMLSDLINKEMIRKFLITCE